MARLMFLLRMLWHPPILLYQMGKVGSSSLRATLSEQHPGLVLHAHAPSMISAKVRWLLRLRKIFGRRVYVISPVRDPLSRNASAFFQNFERVAGQSFASRQWDMPSLKQIYLERYWHDEVGEWFDTCFLPVFGIDVLANDFPRKRKWQTYDKAAVRVLVYRSDLDRAEQLALVSRFLNMPIAAWSLSNVSSEKEYGEAYRTFTRKVKFSAEHIDRVTGTRFCRHFWTPQEIAEQRARWQIAEEKR